MSLKVREFLKENPDFSGNRRELLWWPDYDAFRAGDEETVKREIRTKQSFKDSTDINKIIKKAQKAGTISHLQKYPEAVYGEFDGEFDLLTAHERIQKANDIFAECSSEVRREFNNNALEYVAFVNDPKNKGKLADVLPEIAKPGKYFPNPVQRGGQGAAAATAPQEPVEAPSDPLEGVEPSSAT